MTANANLTEFNESALRYYTTLAANVLVSDGVFLVQCQGGGHTSADTALRAVLAAGFMPLAVIPRHIANGAPKETTLPEGMQTAVANFVLVLPSHPSAARAARREQSIPLIDADDPLTRSIFGLDLPKGSMRSRDDLLTAVVERLKTLD